MISHIAMHFSLESQVLSNDKFLRNMYAHKLTFNIS
jgi:hypothetical protein